jgi:hypothetical protein
MSVGIPVRDGAYKTWGERAAYFDQLQEKVATISGVSMTAISINATPPANGFSTHVEFLGKTAQDEQKVLVNFVSPRTSRCYEFRWRRGASGMRRRTGTESTWR